LFLIKEEAGSAPNGTGLKEWIQAEVPVRDGGGGGKFDTYLNLPRVLGVVTSVGQ
jgi:hypothetical protein